MSSFVEMLVEMGFTKNKAEKAVSVTGNQGVEPAMEWLLAHADSLEESEASTTASGDQTQVQESQTETNSSENAPSTSVDTIESQDVTPKSLKCNDCGKLFATQVEVEFHAVKTNHSNFSESTEEKKPLTEEEKVEQLKRLEEKMKQKRKEREEKEKEEIVEKERTRIKSGKEMIAAKKRLEDDEIKKMVEQRKREKEEDKMARQRVKDQIEQDKLARREKFGGGGTPEKTASNSATISPQASIIVQKDYPETKLQIRLTDGQSLTQTFGAKEQLSAVRLYVELNRTDGSGPFSLMTNFPKKIFVEDDYDKTLDILGLVPSAVVIVSRSVLA